MGLSDLIASAIATAKVAVGGSGGTLVTVTHYPVSGNNGYGPTYPADDAGIERVALVEQGQSDEQGAGIEIVQIAKLTFLEPVVVTARDRFKLPNGDVGEVLKNYALFDAAGVPYMNEVTLGPTGRRAQ